LERKLTAILCADVYGYSRLMGEDEEATLRTLSAYRKITDSLIEQHHGRFVNSAGDSVLAEFASVVEAVSCAVAIQTAIKMENAQLPADRRMEFRIGVNLGDVMVEGEQIYGDGVNVAARLESLADPGGICISGTVHDQVRDKLALAYEDRGEQAVKNIARPVRAWRVLLDQAAKPHAKMRRYWRKCVLSLAGIAIIIATFVLVQHLSFRPQRTHASVPTPSRPALSPPRIPSIAVLPFTNLSGDPSQEYFGPERLSHHRALPAAGDIRHRS
jgi:adenylate cyclase